MLSFKSLRSQFLKFLLFFLLSAASSNAFNITKILSQYSDFSTFNDGLSQTGLAGTINSRQTITVLAVDNSGMSGVPGGMLKEVLSLHVVLDYYDVQKLQQLPNKSDVLTTLFQASGQANGKQGFLNVTRTSNGVVFGSAIPSSSLSSNLVKSIASQPYNISVLQVSSAIVPPNVGGHGSGSNSSSNSTGSSSSPASTPAKPPQGNPTSSPAGSTPKSSPTTRATSLPDAPASSQAGSLAKSSATAPAPSNNSSSASPPTDDASSPNDATAPSDSAADSPSNATVPTADSPAAGTPAASSPLGSAADAPAADAPGGKSSSVHTRPHGYLISGFGAIVWSMASIIG